MFNVLRKANAVGKEYTLESLALELNEVKSELTSRDFDELTVERQGLDIHDVKRELELLKLENQRLEQRLTGMRKSISTVGKVVWDITIILVAVSALLIMFY